jgi:hypothetical protein
MLSKSVEISIDKNTTYLSIMKDIQKKEGLPIEKSKTFSLQLERNGIFQTRCCPESLR